MNKDLHKPLLGDTVEDVDNVESSNNSNNRQNDEDDDDVRAVWFLCSLKVMGSGDADDIGDDEDDLEKNLIMDDDVNDDEDDTSMKEIESSSSRRWYWNCFISSILPFLLYFQFYITYHFNSAYETEAFESSSSMIMMTNDWPSIQWSIFLFIVTSVLYRQSMAFQKDTNSDDKNSISYFELLLHLVPDIIIDILLILILFHYYMAAVLIMQISTIFLAVNAILNSCNCSIYVGTSTTHERN